MSEISTNENKSQEKLRDDSFAQLYLEPLNEWPLSSIFMLLASSHVTCGVKRNLISVIIRTQYNWPHLCRSNALTFTKLSYKKDLKVNFDVIAKIHFIAKSVFIIGRKSWGKLYLLEVELKIFAYVCSSFRRLLFGGPAFKPWILASWLILVCLAWCHLPSAIWVFDHVTVAPRHSLDPVKTLLLTNIRKR